MRIFDIRDDGGDVEAILAKVRDNLKQEAGGARDPVSLYYRTEDRHHPHLLMALQDPRPQGPIAAHGSVVIEAVKRFIRRLLAPYHRGIFARQAEFNAGVVRVIGDLVQQLEKISDGHRALAEDVQARFDAIQEGLEEVAEKHAGSVERIAELRQEMIMQKRRFDLILWELRTTIEDPRQPLATGSSLNRQFTCHNSILFEDRFRGTRHEIKKRQEIYLPLFEMKPASHEQEPGNAMPPPILDVGCGRGEFLELLRDRGIPGKGIDLNDEMVSFCRERGLDVERANALTYLREQPDDSLGGVIACQVIEHLTAHEMAELIRLSCEKLVKGGRAVFETVNPLSLMVSATDFYLDLSHVRQVHPASIQFLAEVVGFSKTEITFLAPYPDAPQLQLLNVSDAAFQQINENFKRLNEILFGYRDYALICQK